MLVEDLLLTDALRADGCGEPSRVVRIASVLEVLGLVLLDHVYYVLTEHDLHDLFAHGVKVAHSLFCVFALGHVLGVEVGSDLLIVRLVLRVNIDNICKLIDVIQVEEEICHVYALFRESAELVLTIQERQLLHLVQVQVALVVLLQQALEDEVLFAKWLTSCTLLRSTRSQRILILDYFKKAQALRMLFLHDLINDAPFRKAGQLGLPQVLEETVCLEEHDAIQAPLLPLQNLHPILDECLYLLLLLLNVECLLVKLELPVFFVDLIEDFFWDREAGGTVRRVLREHELVDLL